MLFTVTESGNLVYTFNAHGDVTRVSDENGVKLNSYEYDAFGNITEKVEAVANTFFYSGYEYDDETGLYYLRTRYYDPKIARFISEDTFPGWYTDPLSLNKYTYTHNNPVSYHDPNGTSIFGDIWGGIKKGVSSATKWVSNNIVKPIKEIFTPKKESSPASVGQNAATNNKYTPTSSGGKKNYSSGSSVKSSSGSGTESSTGYNGISKESQNSIENAQEKFSTLSKGFESGEGTGDNIKATIVDSLKPKKDGVNVYGVQIMAGLGAYISLSGGVAIDENGRSKILITLEFGGYAGVTVGSSAFLNFSKAKEIEDLEGVGATGIGISTPHVGYSWGSSDSIVNVSIAGKGAGLFGGANYTWGIEIGGNRYE